MYTHVYDQVLPHIAAHHVSRCFVHVITCTDSACDRAAVSTTCILQRISVYSHE